MPLEPAACRTRPHTRWRGAGLLLAALLPGCPDAPIEWQSVRLALRPAEDESCAPAGEYETELTALGDFSKVARTLAGGVETAAYEDLPVATRALRFSAQATTSGWTGGALVGVPVGASLDSTAVLYPPSQLCSLDEELAMATRLGAVAAPTADGGILVAGGVDDGGPTAVGQRSAVRLGPGLVDAVFFDMNDRRYGASATRSGERIVVVGGAAGLTGPAHDTYEIYDPVVGDFLLPTRSLCADVTECSGRRDHGAAALVDGTLLVVGGVAGTGARPMVTAFLLNSDRDRVTVLGELPDGRVHPDVVVLSDSSAWVVGGLDAEGRGRGTVFSFDAQAQTFVDVTDEYGGELSPAPGRAVALPGGRLAWIGGGAGALAILRPGESSTVASTALDALLPEVIDAAIALLDGRILVAGHGDAGEDVRVLDPGSGTTTEIEVPGRVRDLVRTDDGAVVFLSEGGAGVRLDAQRSVFDHPPAEIVPGDVDVAASGLGAWLVSDASDHWFRSSDALVAAEDGARILLPGVTFANVDLTLQTVDGEVEIVWTSEGVDRAQVSITADRVAVGSCAIGRLLESPVSVVRRGSSLALRAGDDERSCSADLPEHVAVELRYSEGAQFRGLQIARR